LSTLSFYFLANFSYFIIVLIEFVLLLNTLLYFLLIIEDKNLYINNLIKKENKMSFFLRALEVAGMQKAGITPELYTEMQKYGVTNEDLKKYGGTAEDVKKIIKMKKGENVKKQTKTLETQEGFMCMAEAMQILGNKLTNMEDEEKLPQMAEEIKKKIISFLKEHHDLDEKNCELVLNNFIEDVDENVMQILSVSQKETFSETVRYIKSLGHDIFIGYDTLIKHIISE